MDDGIISIYWYDIIYILDHIINWGFRLCLVVLLYQAVEFLNWRD